jgi:hypothetical protein
MNRTVMGKVHFHVRAVSEVRTQSRCTEKRVIQTTLSFVRFETYQSHKTLKQKEKK